MSTNLSHNADSVVNMGNSDQNAHEIERADFGVRGQVRLERWVQIEREEYHNECVRNERPVEDLTARAAHLSNNQATLE